MNLCSLTLFPLSTGPLSSDYGVTHTHTHTHSYHPQGHSSQTGVTRLSRSLWRSLTKAQHKRTIPNIGLWQSPVDDTWKQNVCVCVRACVCACLLYLPCQIEYDQHVVLIANYNTTSIKREAISSELHHAVIYTVWTSPCICQWFIMTDYQTRKSFKRWSSLHFRAILNLISLLPGQDLKEKKKRFLLHSVEPLNY